MPPVSFTQSSVVSVAAPTDHIEALPENAAVGSYPEDATTECFSERGLSWDMPVVMTRRARMEWEGPRHSVNSLFNWGGAGLGLSNEEEELAMQILECDVLCKGHECKGASSTSTSGLKASSPVAILCTRSPEPEMLISHI
jgi:hypothetical protein